jgi:transcriptional regulator with XRE-family HTH domain
MTQQDLANRVEMQRSHIARIEAGRYSVGLDTLTAIAQALGKRLAFV